MSCHVIYYKDGAKMMRPVHSREEYLRLRNSDLQQKMVSAVRCGDESLKQRLLQMNYSCLPNQDGTLKGATQVSNTVGMDIDHIPEGQMQTVKESILAKAAELGLLMLEMSARQRGYHLVFRRRPDLSQEENLRWASTLLGVDYDKGAKDITRVFFTTTANEDDLIFLSDEIFRTLPQRTLPQPLPCREGSGQGTSAENTLPTNVTAPSLQGRAGGESSSSLQGRAGGESESAGGESFYNGHSFSSIIQKYWELYNDGKEPTEGDRNVLTFELAVTLRSICGYSLERLMQVIPNYWKRTNVTAPSLQGRAGGESFREGGGRVPLCPLSSLRPLCYRLIVQRYNILEAKSSIWRYIAVRGAT